MSKSFRRCKNFCKRYGMKGKLTFADYKKSLHSEQKLEKRKRKNFLKAKSILSQSRESVFVENAFYYWGKDKKSIVALVPDFDGIRKATEMIKKSAAQYESNN